MRKARIKINNGCYHVTSNFHPGVQKFICGWVKRKLFYFVKSARKRFRFKVKNICIMDTHFHLILRPEENEDLSKIVAWFKQKFTQWLNRQFGLAGTAWTDRFYSKIIDTLECLETLSQYIAQNLIKTGLSSTLENYPFYQTGDKDFKLKC